MNRLRSISPFARVILGLVLGIITGLFVGEPAGVLEIGGNAYIRLLQMTVLPYIVVSLIGGLGRLDAGMARRIGVRGGLLILFLWGMAITVVMFMPLAFPNWTSASFFSTSLIAESAAFDPLALYIPANPFHSLANNVVPSIVLFSICVGVALISVKNKGGLIEGLQNLADALMRIASFVAKLAPLGIFAISAAAAGTLQLGELGRLQVYIYSYIVAWGVLTLFALPMLVGWGTTLSYRQTMKVAREAMVTAFATGTVLVVLPMIAERAKEMLAERELLTDETETTVDVLVPTAYSFPSSGTILGLAFILFAAWFQDSPLTLLEYPTFAVLGVLSAFGLMAVALPFLLDYFQLPTDMFQLYLLGSVITMRFATALAACHGVVICLLGACSMVGGIHWRRLLQVLAATVLVALLSMLGLRLLLTTVIPYEYTGTEAFEGTTLVGPAVEAESVPETAPLSEADRARPRLEVIRERGTLRVAYLPDRLPFAFRNDHGDVVGMDLDLMHDLARDLDLSLELVRIELDERVPELLSEGRVDILASGMVITPRRAGNVLFARSHSTQTLAFLVPDHRRTEFSNFDSVARMEGLRLGIGPSQYYEDLLASLLPQAEVSTVPSPREYLRGNHPELDALVYTAEAGSAWTLVYPDYSVAVPKGLAVKGPLAFALPAGQSDMVTYMNTWLDLKERNGRLDQLYRYWILGEQAVRETPRWSVIRNVLHWVD